MSTFWLKIIDMTTNEIWDSLYLNINKSWYYRHLVKKKTTSAFKNTDSISENYIDLVT